MNTAPLNKKVLFLSDLDGTWLSKNPTARKALDEGVVALKDEYRKQGVDLEFGYVTARPPLRVASENLPTPDWTITYNGGTIHNGESGILTESGEFQERPPMAAWEKANQETHFNAEQTIEKARGLIAQPEYQNLNFQTVGQVVHTPASDACPYLAVLCFDQTSIKLQPDEAADKNNNGIPDVFEKETFKTPHQIDSLLSDLRQELDADGVGYQVSPVYPFRGKPVVMFDVSSPIADKGDAIEFIMHQEHITPQHVIVAGDGGNDIAMMRAKDGSDEGRRAIVVGGEAQLYEAAESLQHAILQPPAMDSAEAVLDGLRKHLDQIAHENAA